MKLCQCGCNELDIGSAVIELDGIFMALFEAFDGDESAIEGIVESCMREARNNFHLALEAEADPFA